MDALKLKPNEPATVEGLFKLAHTIDQFEQYTRPHASQIAQLSESIAIRLGISGADLNAIKLAALMHDIGELAMDAPGIRATGHLDFKHRIELWRHPIIGEQQLAKRGLPRQAQFLVRWHHEWWNGSGYPDMLSGETIPVGARILRLADTFDALTAWRPYREAFSLEQAGKIIASSAGIEFDPVIVKVFLDILEEMQQAAAALEQVELPAVPEPLPEPILIEPVELQSEPELEPAVEPVAIESNPEPLPAEASFQSPEAKEVEKKIDPEEHVENQPLQ